MDREDLIRQLESDRIRTNWYDHWRPKWHAFVPFGLLILVVLAVLARYIFSSTP